MHRIRFLAVTAAAGALMTMGCADAGTTSLQNVDLGSAEVDDASQSDPVEGASPDLDRADDGTGSDPGGPVIPCLTQAECDILHACLPADCPGCSKTCQPHGCPTELVPTCQMLRPDCFVGAVSVLQDGCWACVDLATCTVPLPTDESDAASEIVDDLAGEVAGEEVGTAEPAPDPAPDVAMPDDTGDVAPVDVAAEAIDPGSDGPGPDVGGEIAGTWLDPATGLRWQEPPSDQTMSASKAATYCSGLELGGLTDWRLPTVGELRGLIRGCDKTVVGGTCKVGDSCVQSTCGGLFDCLGCGVNGGPNQGCYWPDALTGPCTWYWSGTKVVGAMGGTTWWAALYEDGSLRQSLELSVTKNNVRCVR